MEHLTRTPFGRPVSAGLLASNGLVEAELSVHSEDKWRLFRKICAARSVIGVTDRDLTVLNALLSFYPGTELEEGAALIVFPSNASLSERAHGMAESTLRRHLAALVRAGVILRHDSPNGKRYAARGRDGSVMRAFGFDLRPLLVRAAEFTEASERVTEALEALRSAREACVLKLRDCAKLAAYGREEGLQANWDAIEDATLLSRRALRRRLTLAEIATLDGELAELLTQITLVFGEDHDTDTEVMGGNDTLNERHYHNSKPDTYESEPYFEKGARRGAGSSDPEVPLVVVLKACSDLQDYVPDRIRHWHQLVAAADILHGMMGVSDDAWRQASIIMGRERAAIVLVCMLQRMSKIGNPGGYLRALTAKAEEGSFSSGPMVMALLNISNFETAKES